MSADTFAGPYFDCLENFFILGLFKAWFRKNVHGGKGSLNDLFEPSPKKTGENPL